MVTQMIKTRIKQLLCYASVLSLVFSMAGKVYGQDISYLGVRVKQVASRGNHTVILDEEGNVWAWGANEKGQLGDGSITDDKSKPVAVYKQTNLGKVKQVAVGRQHTVVLDDAGNVWTWGDNEMGQLGDGTTVGQSQRKPMEVSKKTGLGKVTQIAAGEKHTVALDDEGNVWTWGYNEMGQLGDGTTEHKSKPVAVSKETGLGKVTQIAAGVYHTVALDDEGNVWTWGSNRNGQLGDGTTEYKSKPVAVSKETGLVKVTQIAAGVYHTVALDDEGNVWTWGDNYFGQLGDDTRQNEKKPKKTTLEKVKKIAAGYDHTAVIDEEGNVWTWGYNLYGQLGDGTLDRIKGNPVAVSKETGLEKAEQIAAGLNHTVALDNEGNVWTWGYNDLGQLGDESKESSSVPVQSLIYTIEVELTADMSENDVEHDLEITFLPNRTFENHINGVKVNGVSLKKEDYKAESGKITLLQSDTNPELRKAGNAEITVSAEYYPDSKVNQTINACKPHHMELEQDITSPIANKEPFNKQPVIHIVDNYGNLCINDNTTQMTVSKKDSGDWTLAGTTTAVAMGGIVTFTDLKAINDDKVEGAQLSFSSTDLGEISSSEVILPAELSLDVPQIESVEEGDGSVTLAWREAEGARSYEVYVSTKSQSYTTPAALTINTVHSYEITGLENRTIYYFVVRAVNEGGRRSDYSNEVSAVPRTVPAPPRNVKATASNKKAVISFDEPLDNGGSPILKYVVTSSPGNIVAEGTKSPITVNGLTNETSYTFTVKAINKAGASHESEPTNPVVPKGSSGGGGGTTGGSGGATSDDQKESDKDVLAQGKKENHDSKVDIVMEINGKPVKNIAQVILRTQNGKRVGELILDEAKLKEVIKQETQTTGQVAIRFVFDKEQDGIEIEQIIYNISKEVAKYSGYVELRIPLSGNMDKDKFFNDMKGHWAEDIVNNLASRLILDSDGKENFEPNKKTTRKEFAVIITKALGLMQKGAGKDLFSDISKEDNYYDAVTIAYEYGIISGYGDGSFMPDKEITREEAMGMMIRAMKAVGIEISLDEEEINSLLSRYPDNSSISPWAREYVAICTKLGIVTGRNDKMIVPKDSISMAEMAVVIEKLLRALDLI